jgi:hypothetical protein
MPSGGGTPLQLARDGGATARESPDGKFLYYAKSSTVPTTIWKVPAKAHFPFLFWRVRISVGVNDQPANIRHARIGEMRASQAPTVIILLSRFFRPSGRTSLAASSVTRGMPPKTW